MTNLITFKELTELKELAEKATAGPWVAQFNHHKAFLGDSLFDIVTKLSSVIDEQVLICQAWSKDAEYLAAANPDKILRMIEALERANKMLKESENIFGGLIMGTFHMVKQLDGSIRREYVKTELGEYVDHARELLNELEGIK